MKVQNQIKQKYVIYELPPSFLYWAESIQEIVKHIQTIEKSHYEEDGIDKAYSVFESLVKNEIDVK